jgi:hypothetical protein
MAEFRGFWRHPPITFFQIFFPREKTWRGGAYETHE